MEDRSSCLKSSFKNAIFLISILSLNSSVAMNLVCVVCNDFFSFKSENDFFNSIQWYT